MPPLDAAIAGGARARRSDHRHDRRAGRGLCADRLPERPDRRAVHRIRLHAGRRGHGVGDRRADAVADDVLAAPQAATIRSHGGWEARLTDFIDRSFERLRRRLSAPAAWQPGLPAGHDRLRRYHPGQHLFPVHGGAKTELAPQEDQGVIICASIAAPERHAAAAPALFAPGLQDLLRPSRRPTHVFQIDMPGQSIAGMVLKPWDERTRDHATQLQPVLQQRAEQRSPATAMAAFQPPPLPGAQRPAGPVRDRHHRAVRAAQRRRAAVPAGGAAKRHVHLPRHRSEDRPAAGRRRASTATRPRSSA